MKIAKMIVNGLPKRKIMEKIIGITYVSGLFSYGT